MRFPPFLPGMGLPHNGRGGAGMSLDDKDDDKSSDDDTMDLKHMVKMERYGFTDCGAFLSINLRFAIFE